VFLFLVVCPRGLGPAALGYDAIALFKDLAHVLGELPPARDVVVGGLAVFPCPGGVVPDTLA